MRAYLEDSGAVSNVLSADVVARGIQHGQGTQWEDDSDRILMWGNNAQYVSGSRSQHL